MSRLIIVQCGQKKVWERNPGLGPVKAKDAYTSTYFRSNAAYATRFGDRWLILSAKYGFLNPDDLIEDYNATFKKKSTRPISIADLRGQVEIRKLDDFDHVEVLGGEEYYAAVKAAFQGLHPRIEAPFRGLSIGKRMAAIKKFLKILDQSGEKRVEGA